MFFKQTLLSYLHNIELVFKISYLSWLTSSLEPHEDWDEWQPPVIPSPPLCAIQAHLPDTFFITAQDACEEGRRVSNRKACVLHPPGLEIFLPQFSAESKTYTAYHVPGTVLSILHMLIYSLWPPYEVTSILIPFYR